MSALKYTWAGHKARNRGLMSGGWSQVDGLVAVVTRTTCVFPRVCSVKVEKDVGWYWATWGCPMPEKRSELGRFRRCDCGRIYG